MQFNKATSRSLPHSYLSSMLLAIACLFAPAAPAAGIHGATISKISPDLYRVDSPACKLQLEVNAYIGGRITQLQFDNKPIIAPYACGDAEYVPMASCNGSGSTFWTSPQKAWPNGGWPPVASVDGEAYTAHIKNEHLLLNGPGNTVLGASINKDFSIDSAHCSVALQYTINASRAQHMAPWEITRVPRGGIALFPLGDNSRLSPGPLAARVSIASGVVWFDDTGIPALPLSGGAKLIADGRAGWLAYVSQGMLYIKQFSDVTPDATAPGEGDVEIYAGKDILELEAQGRYASLKAGDSLPWKVRWQVAAIPESVTIATGSKSLLQFVEQEVSKVR